MLRETFTRGVGLAGDIGTIVAVTRPSGSTNPGLHYAHQNHRGDVVLTRNGNTTSSTYRYSAFGALLGQTVADVSRFKNVVAFLWNTKNLTASFRDCVQSCATRPTKKENL